MISVSPRGMVVDEAGGQDFDEIVREAPHRQPRVGAVVDCDEGVVRHGLLFAPHRLEHTPHIKVNRQNHIIVEKINSEKLQHLGLFGSGLTFKIFYTERLK